MGRAGFERWLHRRHCTRAPAPNGAGCPTNVYITPLRGPQVPPFPILRETLNCLTQTGKGFLLKFGACGHSLFSSSTAFLPPAPPLALCQYVCLGTNLDHHRPGQRTRASLRSATSSTPRNYNGASAWKGKKMTNLS